MSITKLPHKRRELFPYLHLATAALLLLLGLHANAAIPCTETTASKQDAPLQRFGFRWDVEWTWEKLATFVAQESPRALSHVERLRHRVSLPYARLVMRHLAKLPNLADVRFLPDRTALDWRIPRLERTKTILKEALRNFWPRNNLEDMLATASVLAQARAHLADCFVPDLHGKKYKPEPTQENAPSHIQVRFDFRLADQLLNILSKDNTPDTERAKIVDDIVFKQLLRRRGIITITRGQAMEWLRRAQDPSPLNRLYEWVYPGSYFDFGGVAVYAEGYRSLVQEIKSAQNHLIERVRARLSRFLPKDLSLEITVNFLFAGEADGWTSGRIVGIHLEHMGDDFGYLSRVIAHECFHYAQSAACWPLTTLVSEGEARALHDGLMMAVWREGMASYVGADWVSSPPITDIVQGFKLFTEAFDKLHRQRDLAAYKRIIQQGLAGSGPLYRMGWHMAKAIEAKKGLNAFVDVQILGPAILFARYIEAYRDSTLNEVPATLRFRPDIEDAILHVAAGVDAPTLLEAARIRRLNSRQAVVEAALRFVAKYAKRSEAALALIQLGEHIARQFQDASTAQKLMEPGLRILGAQQEELVKRAGYLFLEQGTPEQAIAVFQIGVETAPHKATRHYLLGECYRLLGELESARAAYRRALALDSQFAPAQRALARIGGQPL
jgi:tetratricopeptide (TPR) repeat protein